MMYRVLSYVKDARATMNYYEWLTDGDSCSVDADPKGRQARGMWHSDATAIVESQTFSDGRMAVPAGLNPAPSRNSICR